MIYLVKLDFRYKNVAIYKKGVEGDTIMFKTTSESDSWNWNIPIPQPISPINNFNSNSKLSCHELSLVDESETQQGFSPKYKSFGVKTPSI